MANIVVVWALTGLWHGASWNFLLWGFYFCVLIILEKKLLGRILFTLPAFAGHAYTFTALMFSWPLFYFTDISRMLECFRVMLGGGMALYDVRAVSVLGTNAFLLPVLLAGCTPLARIAVKKIRERAFFAILEPIFIAVVMAASFVAIVGQSYSPFLYFRF